MGDITNPKLLYLKGALFLAIGAIASAIILLDHPGVKVAALLALAIWAFCRTYYFAFYVIEHYVDGQYKFAGLLHFLRYCIAQRHRTGV